MTKQIIRITLKFSQELKEELENASRQMGMTPEEFIINATRLQSMRLGKQKYRNPNQEEQMTTETPDPYKCPECIQKEEKENDDYLSYLESTIVVCERCEDDFCKQCDANLTRGTHEYGCILMEPMDWKD